MSLTVSATQNTVVPKSSNINPPIITPLSLPPKGIFDLYNALFSSVQQYTKEALYAFIIRKANCQNNYII